MVDPTRRLARRRAGDPVAEPNETILLAGRPTLRRFIRFVARNAVAAPDRGALIEEWQAAREHVRALESVEQGLADHPEMTQLGPEYEPLLVEFLKDPLVRHGFNTVPTDVAIVELDRLVVYQKHIDVTHTGRLEARLGPAPSEEQVFRTCLPYDHPQPPVKWSRVHENRFVFMSPSNDLRFLGTMELLSAQIANYPPPGDLVGVVGIGVGFGSNFLNAIYAENRLILNNGSHRAYALRKLGITHVPCIVQHVSSRDELDVVASAEIRDNPDLYLQRPRPMMLRDYFDPKLHKVMPVHRRLRPGNLRVEGGEQDVSVA